MRHHYRAALAAAVSLFCGEALSASLAGGWFRGDLHVHDDHSSDGSLPRQCCDQLGPGNNAVTNQIAFATLTGMDFLPLTDHRTYDQHYDPLWESPAVLLLRGEEANGSPHATVHGGVDSIVQGPNPPGAPNFVNVQQSIWEAHAQDANWVTAHPDDGETNDDGTPNARASAIGIDLIEVWNRGSNIDKEMAYAEQRWDQGFRTGIAGASDDHFIELWAAAGPGMPSTWVFAADQRERAVIDGLRAGHTALSSDVSAPLLTMTADFNGDGVADAMGGDEVVVPKGTRGTLYLQVDYAPNTKILVYKSPGRSAGPIATFNIGLLQTTFTLPVVAGSAPTWYRAEARGPGLPDHYDISDVPLSLVPEPTEIPNQLRTTTSPIFVSPAPVNAQGEIPLPADAGVNDGAALVLGDAGLFVGFPDVAVANDIVHVVAEKHDALSRSEIVYRRRVAGVTQPAIALTAFNIGARFPKIAARGNDVWVVWQNEYLDELPHRPTIFLRHSADGGKTWAPQLRIRRVEGRCEHPAIALTTDGLPIVAWQEISALHPFDVMVQILGRDPAPVNVSWDDIARKTVNPALPGDTRSSRYPASVWPTLAVAADGRVAVGWQDDRTDPDPLWTGRTGVGDGTDPDNWQIMVRVRGPASSSWNAPASLGSNDRSDRHPSLAFDAGGALNAVWSSKVLEASGVPESVMTSRTTDGRNWSAPQILAPNPSGMSVWPKLARAADGKLRTAWHDSRSADWRWRVMTAKQGTGGVWGAAQLLPSRGINTWPALAGNALVFASTRNAARLQRDKTQQIFELDLP